MIQESLIIRGTNKSQTQHVINELLINKTVFKDTTTTYNLMIKYTTMNESKSL